VELIEAVIVKINPGENKIMNVKFKITEGYHIMSNDPGDENLIPTTLQIASVQGIRIDKIGYPLATRFNIEGSDNKFFVFEHTVSINIPVTISKMADRNEYTLDASLHYQACNSLKCFFPDKLNFKIMIRVE
jgi:DsbC/DsbD-like thiol-disulfide interchange protein